MKDVPSTIGIVVIGWAQGWISMQLSGTFASMPSTTPAPVLFMIMVLSGTGVLWFIQMLWIYSMILALLKKHEKGKLFEWGSRANIIVLILFPILRWCILGIKKQG